MAAGLWKDRHPVPTPLVSFLVAIDVEQWRPIVSREVYYYASGKASFLIGIHDSNRVTHGAVRKAVKGIDVNREHLKRFV